MIYILSSLIGTIIGSVVSTLIYHLRTKLGVLYIDEGDPEGEKWRIEIDGGVLEKRRKRMVLRIIRSGGRVKY